jgi:cell division control protein 6
MGEKNCFLDNTTTRKTESKIFKDKKILSSDYIPPRLHYRDKQKSIITEAIKDRLEGLRTNLWVGGPYGTGKTATIQRVKQDFEETEYAKNAKVVYVQCRVSRNKYKTYLEILRQLNPTTEVKDGSTETKILDSIRAEIKTISQGAVIILDELDKIIKETKDDDLLYQFLETEKATVIVISNDTKWTQNLKGDTFSRWRGSSEDLWFPNYTPEEMLNILIDRAREALKPNTYGVSTLMAVVDYVQKEGDARNILQLLRITAEKAEKDEEATGIEMKHICLAKKDMHDDKTKKIIQGLDTHRKTLLLTVAKSNERTLNYSTDEVITTYTHNLNTYITKHNGILDTGEMEPLSRPSLYRALKEMGDQSIIYAENSQYIKGVGRKPQIWKTFWTEAELYELWNQKE